MIDNWSAIFNIENIFVDLLNSTGVEISGTCGVQVKNHIISARSWVSPSYLVAHLTILDARSSNGVWMLHCCIYPHFNNPNPIYGFDVVVGKSKITGFFHDFSPTSSTTTPLSGWFENTTNYISWNKKRALPEWARLIFSDNMIAASNVQSMDELSTIYDLANVSLYTYLSEVGNHDSSFNQGSTAQYIYLQSQKNNHHTPRVLQSLGFSDLETVDFINNHLFPEVISHSSSCL